MWAFSGYQPVRGYPKSLSSVGLPRGVRKIDAVFYDAESGKTLFFVDNYYYRCVLTIFVKYELFSTYSRTITEHMYLLSMFPQL